MKEWKPGLIVTDHDATRNPENKQERQIAAYLALELRMISVRAKIDANKLAKKSVQRRSVKPE